MMRYSWHKCSFYICTFLGHPIRCRQTMFYHSSVFLSFFRQLHPELAEWNSAKTSHVFGSKFDLKTYVENLGYTLPLKTGGPEATFFYDFAT